MLWATYRDQTFDQNFEDGRIQHFVMYKPFKLCDNRFNGSKVTEACLHPKRRLRAAAIMFFARSQFWSWGVLYIMLYIPISNLVIRSSMVRKLQLLTAN